MRPSRWVHLAAWLEVRRDAGDEALLARPEQEANAWIAGSGRIARRPAGGLQRRIGRELPALGAGQRRAIDWVLRTTD